MSTIAQSELAGVRRRASGARVGRGGDRGKRRDDPAGERGVRVTGEFES